MTEEADNDRKPDQGPRVSPLAGKVADPSMLVNIPRLVAAYYTGRPDPSIPGAARQLWHLRPSRLLVDLQLQRMRTSWPSPRRSAATGRSRASTGRCSSASTPTRSPSRRSGVRSKCWPPTRSPSTSPSTTSTRRRRRSRTPSSPTTAAARSGLADGIVITPSHNPPDDGGFKYNPPHGGPAGGGDDAVHRERGERACWPTGWRR